MADEIRVDRERALAIAGKIDALVLAIADTNLSLASVGMPQSTGAGARSLMGVVRQTRVVAGELSGLAARTASMVRRCVSTYGAADEAAKDQFE